MLYLRICTILYIQKILGGENLLQLEDVCLFYADYTLDFVSDKLGVPKGTMRMLLISIYEQLGALNLDVQKKDFGEQKFPKVLLDTVFLRYCLNDSLKWELLEKVEGGYSLTNRALSIFLQAAEKQKNLNF